MNDSDILCPQHHIDRLFLSGVQIGEMHRRKHKRLRLLVRVEKVAQITDAPLALDGPVQGLHHQSVGRLVERQLHPHVLGILERHQIAVVRQDAHHAVAIDIADSGSEREVFDAILIHVEEHHRLAKFKSMFDILVGGSEHLDSQLVE